MPVSLTKDNIYNASPFIGTPKYFSAIAASEGAYRDNANYFQKPLCYWVRGGDDLSGSCYYLTSKGVDVSVLDYTETNIVGDFIDWVAYDIRLRAWANDLYNAYVNLNNNLRDYLINSLGDSRVSNYLQEQPYIL